MHLNDVSKPQKVKLNKDCLKNTEFSFILSFVMHRINSVTQRKNSLIKTKKVAVYFLSSLREHDDK